MKIRKPNYFNEFKCISSKCEDTCCAGWGIVIDDESYKRYVSVDGEFGEELRSKIINEGGENIFILNGDRCSFLNNDNLCDIYNELGSDSLCYTCKQYPRYFEEFGSLREIGISLSCPEVARIILRNSEKFKFELIENDEEVKRYNDINPMLYMNLMKCRNVVFDILQNRDLNLNVRCILSLIFVKEIQEKIDTNKIEEIKYITNKYIDTKFIYDSINYIDKYKGKVNKKYTNIREILEVFKNLKHITPNDPLALNDVLRYFWQNEDDINVYFDIHESFDNYYKDKLHQFEQILIYFVFRYFMKAVFDYDALAKIKIALVSYIMIRELCIVRYLENKEFTDGDMVDIAHTYSKDIEHLEENIEKLEELFETNNVFNIEELTITLFN